ncbi:tripartite tricarboxylate transporter TctB family protein [Aquibaculum arenosum]|uniref:Tripartite tricarboxylate transporter TctB family protein n=1 Tax=Aquibaculum arenosum TaxID=3032591 RepID=A0ABT5YPQ7_9PROT|nr:tripartite tricarboxylate transporter TctB family protein [Fodinicurvata sp. CAU 1616]MDF2096958.1 tripartite tricarboxylate transporter TctB family protein [Fodinicurvata sp. CAU 1616]
MRFNDMMLGAVLLAFAVVLAGFAMTFPAIPGQRFGAGLFPLLIALGFAACGIALVLQHLRSPHAGREPLVMRTEWTQKPGAILAVLITIAVMIGYILLSRPIGFLPIMALMTLILFRLLQVPWWQALLFAVGGTFVLDLIFRSLLMVPLPYGIIPYLPW